MTTEPEHVTIARRVLTEHWRGEWDVKLAETVLAQHAELERLKSDETINRILWQVCNTFDHSELWSDTRKDPDAYRRAVRFALDLAGKAKP